MALNIFSFGLGEKTVGRRFQVVPSNFYLSILAFGTSIISVSASVVASLAVKG